MEPTGKGDKPPELSLRQYELLHLAGTVRLPTPYPATGSLAIVKYDASCYSDEKTILRLTHKIGDRIDVSRIFRLRDVQAIRATWPSEGEASGKGTEPQKSPPSKRELKVGNAVSKSLEAHLKAHASDPIWLEDASVYLPESAPVVLQVEAAQSAAESADYYPPISQSGRPEVSQNGYSGCNMIEESE
jgi:hypothetical protein